MPIFDLKRHFVMFLSSHFTTMNLKSAYENLLMNGISIRYIAFNEIKAIALSSPHAQYCNSPFMLEYS